MTIARFEHYPNSSWESVVFLHQGQEYKLPYDPKSGEIFNHDPMLLIQIKCCALIGATPLISIARSIHSFAKAIFIALAEAYYYLDGQDHSAKSGLTFHEALSDGVRALDYGISLTKCAIRGIWAPYQARQQYGKLERMLNRHGYAPHRDKFYLAFCFQPLSIISQNSQNYDQAEKKIRKYLNRYEGIHTAFVNCEWQQFMIAVKS